VRSTGRKRRWAHLARSTSGKTNNTKMRSYEGCVSRFSERLPGTYHGFAVKCHVVRHAVWYQVKADDIKSQLTKSCQQ
jgi:hypothetical protein